MFLESKLWFKLLPQTEKNFGIDSKNGHLTVKARHLSSKQYSFNVYVVDLLTNSSDMAAVVVNVPSLSLPGPKIAQNTCGEVTVMENQVIPRVTKILATVNYSISTELHYSIVGGSGGTLFSINESSGIISAEKLDREVADKYILVVSVANEQTPKRVDVCTVNVIVKDANDNAPVFDSITPKSLEISDMIKPGAVLGTVQARDVDEGNNGMVIYKLTKDESGMLDIIPDNGEIIFAR